MYHSSGETQLYSVKKVSFKWFISNFSFCPDEIGESMQSSAFPLETKDEKWCLKIYPGGVDTASKNYISLYLVLVSSKKTEMQASFRFHLINAKNEKAITRDFQRRQIFVQGKERGFRKFIKRNYSFFKSEQLLPNDVITISCEVTCLYPNKVDTAAVKFDQIEKKSVDPDLAKHFEDLFEKQILTDVTFCVEGRQIKAHKAILALKSEVFQAMFATEMQESLTNTIEITDIKYDVLKAMLHFIYTEKAPKSNLTKELLIAADKYALFRLKALCEKELFANITTENSTRVLILADFYNCDQLKTHTLDFIVTFATIILDTEGWRSLEETHPQLIVEAYARMVERQIK